MMFVSYKTKSDAKRGLTRKNTSTEDLNPDQYLRQQDGKWGFDMKGGAPFPLPAFQRDEDQETLIAAMQAGTDAKPKEGVLSAMHGDSDTPDGNAQLAATEHDTKDEPAAHLNKTTGMFEEPAVDDDEEHDPEDAKASSAFGAFALGQLGNAPQREPEPARAQTITKIERNREERNGIKRPSAGTVCDQVWAIATELSNGDEQPRTRIATLSEVVKAAEAKGINKYTARTQYARWRGFHGIVGRVSS